ANATPAWYGHCNGWTSAAIRHAEPQKDVTRNGVVFTPADIKGLLAEVYMYNDPQMLAGDGVEINPGVFHVILTNWIGNGSHPIGMEAEPGKEKWNYPIHAYSARTVRHSPEYVEVGMNITYAMSSRGELQQSPRIPRTKYFHYLLHLNEEGEIIGGVYYRDSSRIDMLWVPLRPKPSGKEGNERGNPHLDVEEVLAIWRSSVPSNLRRSWVIVDPPNRAPSITSAKSTSVAENSTQVMQLSADDQDLEEGLTFVAPQQLEFSLSGGADMAAFVVDPETGELSFVQQPDFELPTDADKNNIYQVKVTVNDGAGETDSQLLNITVTDANDAPAIVSGTKFKAIENQLAALMVDFVDQDQPTQELTCSLTGGEDAAAFLIDSKTGKLTFKQAPDFENPTDSDRDNIYQVEVNVEDEKGGAVSQLLQVAVTDANDRPNITSPKSQTATENQLAVFTVTGTDEDDSNESLLFSLTGGLDRGSFTIDSQTGELTFSNMPDFERPADSNEDNVYEVEISLTDSAGGTASQLFQITLIDANDAPVITSTNTPKAIENGLAVLKIEHRDQDLPPQSVTCTLVGGADRNLFSVDATTGMLAFKQSPNFEQATDADEDNVYEVEVGVADGVGGTATQLISVRVTDANDAPVIVSKSDLKAVESQLKIGAVSAEDEDFPTQQLKFLLSGGADQSRFSIDNKTGELSFKQLPNYESPTDKDQDNKYEIEVEVDDGAGGIAKQALCVAVIDANDRPIMSPRGTVKAAERQLVATTITAQDEDSPPQKLVFSLRGGADRKQFAINSGTGELAFKQAPDFEHPGDADKDNVYVVKIKVEDGAGGTAMQMIRVAVFNANDDPVIMSSDAVEAAENQLAAIKVLAHDEDLPTQALVYSLNRGADQERFAIDAATGDLTFKDAPDFEKPRDKNMDNVYEVEVKVEDDQGGSTTQLVNVTVINVNERPTITYSPKVQENQTEVLTVNVTDEDMSTHDIVISISGGADRDRFVIDSKNGDLAFKTAPDFEDPTDADMNNVYEVEVKVEDGEGGTAVQSIRVKVTDADEPDSEPSPDEPKDEQN
ncbi:MAG TPA: cadherin domain-containing protein, partial [Pirellulaceae bacterium]|nr:cadherin domain-containing protein [Pirellulaceae bacterium]